MTTKLNLKCECGHDAHPNRKCKFWALKFAYSDAKQRQCLCQNFNPVIPLSEVEKAIDEEYDDTTIGAFRERLNRIKRKLGLELRK